MINYDEALAKAKGLKSNIDKCTEYETAFIFSSSADEMSIGGDGPVVIKKSDGAAINMVDYLDEEHGEMLREFELT